MARRKLDRTEKYFRYIEKKYGLTKDAYLRLLVAQKNQCPICDRELVLFSSDHAQMPHVDHAHVNSDGSGPVRALLCTSCNTLEGKISKDLYRVYALLVHAGHIEAFLTGASPAHAEAAAKAQAKAASQRKLIDDAKSPLGSGRYSGDLRRTIEKLWWYKKS